MKKIILHHLTLLYFLCVFNTYSYCTLNQVFSILRHTDIMRESISLFAFGHSLHIFVPGVVRIKIIEIYSRLYSELSSNSLLLELELFVTSVLQIGCQKLFSQYRFIIVTNLLRTITFLLNYNIVLANCKNPIFRL